MIPEKFLERMKKILGESYSEFEEALSRPSVRAVRVNGIKTDDETFLTCFDGELSPIPYARGGYIPSVQEGLGTTPEHHAGMIYVQDGGAMATVNAATVKEGWWVLDSCSAPGGKASQLAELIGDSGFLLANEYVPKRAKTIVSNFERLGVKNAMVVSYDTKELGKMFSECFDLVLCDAPCSGEGMFRKYEDAQTEWSEENVELCARRQWEILENVIPLVRGGGYLLYSTCTYAPEENENMIERVLEEHPDMHVCELSEAVVRATSDAIPSEKYPEISLTRRFYPHASEGEGQYIALLKKDEKSDDLSTILYKNASKPLSKEEKRITEAFLKDNFTRIPEGRLIKHAEFAVLVPHDCPIPEYSVFMSGVTLGEIRKGVFFPHNQLISAYGKDMKRRENLKKGDARVAAYLRGEEIEARESGDGWCAVCYEGVPMGAGKVSAGRIKNHYPKGLRNKN